jgi:hypothetical protein
MAATAPLDRPRHCAPRPAIRPEPEQWESRQMLRQVRGPSVLEYKNAFRVEARATVKVAAGTFEAFRIAHVQEREHNPLGPASGRTWRETLWYSPQGKAFVKREVNTTGVTWGPDWELESYKVK